MSRSNLFIVALFIVIVIVFGVATFWYVNIPKDARDSAATSALDATQKGTFTDLAGNEISFDNYDGTVRVVSSWASWNPFSVTDLQTLNTLAGVYTDKEVTFLAINRKEPKEQAERFLKTLPTLEHLTFAIDVYDTFYTSIGGYAMPETVIYDSSGNIIFHKRGLIAEEELKSALEPLFN